MASWFEDFENRPIRGKDQVPWMLTIEYEIQSKYLIANLKSLSQIGSASDPELLAAAQHCNNLIAWVEQMRIMGYTGLHDVIENLLEDEFGDRQKLINLRQDYTEAWLHGKSGQYKIGENYFTVYHNKFYYHTLYREWYEVKPSSVFDIMPVFGQKADAQTTVYLNSEYMPTRYQQIYTGWQEAGYTGKLLSDLFLSQTGQTTPEDVLEETTKKIQAIVDNPPALEEIERAVSDKPDYLEYLIKISCLVADFAQERRMSNEYSLYLLRDCAMFHEAQILIDLLEGQRTSHDQVYIGRQSLSSKQRDAGHWYVVQELLLMALQKHPDDFSGFYANFTQYLKDYEEYSTDFATLVQDLARYLDGHITESEQSNRPITVIDLGFQGSINMLVKYVLDNYCLQKTKQPAKVHMYVIAEWFRGVYENMYTSNTFSTLTYIEVMTQNNAIYEYVPWSLQEGNLSITYGSKADQDQADIELTVMIMTVLLSKQLKLAVYH